MQAGVCVPYAPYYSYTGSYSTASHLHAGDNFLKIVLQTQLKKGAYDAVGVRVCLEPEKKWRALVSYVY